MEYFLRYESIESICSGGEEMIKKLSLCFILMVSFIPLFTYADDGKIPEISEDASLRFFNHDSWRYGLNLTKGDLDGVHPVEGDLDLSISINDDLKIALLTDKSLTPRYPEEPFEGIGKDSILKKGEGMFYGGINLSLSF